MNESATRHTHARQLPGTPCWASLLVKELGRGQEFYQRLFGWEFYSGPAQPGPYVRALAEGVEVAGLGEIEPDRQLNVAWLPYMAADDADSAADAVRERGGTVAVGPLEADNAGRMAIAADPAGASFGVWQQPAPRPGSLHPATAEVPGAPVWYELITPDVAAVAGFYPAVFGYGPKEGSEEDHDGDEYLTLHVGSTPVAGIRGVGDRMPSGRGPYWKTYFAVADADATARRIAELGGSVVHKPADTPHGRVATAADPEGAQFSVIAHP